MSFISITFPDSDIAEQVMYGTVCQGIHVQKAYHWGKRLTGFLSVTVCTTSSLTLACIAIDRYSAALYPLSYSTKIQQKHCIVILGFCWLWSMLTAMPPILPSKPALYYYHDGTKHCSPSFRTHCWYYWYCTVMGYGIPLPIMTVCYVQIYRILRNQKRKVFGTTSIRLPKVAVIENQIPMKHGDSFGMESNSNINHHCDIQDVGKTKFRKVTHNLTRRPQVQIAKRGAMLILAYFLCWGPYAVLFACPGHIVTAEWVEVMAMWIVYSLVVWNPLIYVFNNHQFRLEMKRFLRRLRKFC
ncbi:hypothetical protein LOTGIDRAFT_164768 [Lottia gigantea]|uniref:G-protein coupled receptors family 1 profile domain-containing protein n=1 Tax=Lottia gigantea TaxID=225164 RepID=V4A8W4_LOTGI|nr:hypothetical protein LOTGIDRAFT_164768 [Lottia gigantea]ESO89746.1 hypothetical protein LOTGIDRAFT_164768 [Lottia gigantea]